MKSVIDQVAVLSDIEGSAAKLESFCARHPAFVTASDGRPQVKPGALFVHGGDVPDRFEGGQRAVAELLRLSDATPERVVLIAGNRDLNKLRLTSELSEAGMAAQPPVKVDEWKAWVEKHPLSPGASERAQRLRWIFTKTMGAADAFELRRRERAALKLSTNDEAIVESFLDELADGGNFRRLVQRSTLLARRGNSIFAHAGLTDDNIGLVPGESERARDVDEWVARLDDWYRAQLSDWARDAYAWSGHGPRPGEDLIRYAEPDTGRSANPRSVVYCRSVDEQGKIALPGEKAIRFLLDSGVRRLVIGHTPSGDLPVVLRTPDDAFEVVVADTSRSEEPETPAIVSLEGNDLDTVTVHGQAKLDGRMTAVAFRSRVGHSAALGKRTESGALVVGPAPGGLLTYQLGPGWKVVYEVISGPSEEPGCEPIGR